MNGEYFRKQKITYIKKKKIFFSIKLYSSTKYSFGFYRKNSNVRRNTDLKMG